MNNIEKVGGKLIDMQTSGWDYYDGDPYIQVIVEIYGKQYILEQKVDYKIRDAWKKEHNIE